MPSNLTFAEAMALAMTDARAVEFRCNGGDAALLTPRRVPGGGCGQAALDACNHERWW
jgi:hypothetical protein